jgi:hypothetical protein
MTKTDHDQGGSTAASGGRIGRNRRTLIGVTGLAAALGVGALVGIERTTGDSRLPDASGGPSVVAESATPDLTADHAGASRRLEGPIMPARVPTSSSPPPLKQRLSDARSANSRLGTEARTPLTSTTGGYVADSSKIRTESFGSLQTDHKTMRVVSAPLDLSGQRELAWVADRGKPYRGAWCSQKIKMSNNVKAAVRPTLLICWRTSANRSAYTLLVNLDKKPSKAESVAALDRAWDALD